jgi:WXG100 family type VII secretion target
MTIDPTYGNINVQPEKLRELASDIRNRQANLERQIAEIGRQMQSLENEGWQSSSGSELRNKFGQLRNDYTSKYPPAFDDYIRFLNEAANHYENTERQRQADIDGLRTTVS